MISSIRSLAADAYRSDKHILWHAITRIAFACYCYWKALYQFLILDHKYNTNLGNIANLPVPDDIWAHTYFYSLALIFKLWKRPHYRNTSFQQDCKDTLANVAIPGTGIPLSLFFYSYYSALFLVLFVNPMICLAGAMNKAYLEYSTLTQFMLDTSNYFESHLFHPQGNRLNCIILHFITLVVDLVMREILFTLHNTIKCVSIPITVCTFYVAFIPDLGSISSTLTYTCI